MTSPNAWTSRAIGGKPGLEHRLTAAQLAGFQTLLAATAHLAPQAVGREDFRHPEIDALCAWIDRTIRRGKGIVALTGLTREAFGEDGLERVYWGIGTHLGDAATQSVNGDRLGHVRHVADDPVARGYRSNEELMPHTDSYPIVGLMCLQRGEEGGFSRFVSGVAIHDAIEAARPDLLAPLYEGYYYALAEAKLSNSPVTDYKIPVFSKIGATVGICYSPEFVKRAARLRGEELPPALREALALVDGLAESDEFRVRFAMEPGEIVLWHNFRMLHARDAYRDSEMRKRHLLRLWLKIDDDDPIDPAMLRRAEIYENIYRQHNGSA